MSLLNILLLIGAIIAVAIIAYWLGQRSATPARSTDSVPPTVAPTVGRPRSAPPPVNAGGAHHPGDTPIATSPPVIVPPPAPLENQANKTPSPPARTAAPPPAAAASAPRPQPRPPAAPPSGQAGTVALANVKSWGYQLQHLDIARAAISPFDLLVVDYAKDGSDDTALKPAEIERMKRKPDGSRRLVIAYMSIGEAESYRFYWDDTWKRGEPAWLLGENPEWKENYAVCFWEPSWQHLMCGAKGSYLDKIIDAGFDGVYLDKCDVYEDLQNRHKREAKSRPHIEQDMVAFIERISRHAKSRAPGFAVIMQNAEGLLSDARLRGALDGVAKESLIFGLEGPEDLNSSEEYNFARDQLSLLKADGKAVLVVEYIANQAKIKQAADLMAKSGFVLYISPKDRELAKLNFQTIET